VQAEWYPPIRVACVGDSITYGAGTPNPANDSYPAQLATQLGKNWTVMNYGVMGATVLKKGDMPYWRTNEFRLARKFKPNVVIIALGTNDLKPGNLKNITEFVEDYVLMIESFRKLEIRPDVWICYPVSAYPVNWRVTGSVIAKGVMLLIDKFAGQSDANIIDLYGALSNRKEFFTNTVHPNTDGAKLMAETIKAVITAGKTPSLSPHKHTQHRK